MTRILLFGWAILILTLFAWVSMAKSARIEHDNPLVNVAEMDTSIIVEMRYAGEHNFLGRIVPGYLANKCLLVREVAVALAEVQKMLLKKSLSLKVYDCYRPQMAVSAFMAWADDPLDKTMKTEFYPRESKTKLIEKGYIAKRSGHSRGDSLDLTIVKLPAAPQTVFNKQQQQDCTAPATDRYRDNSLDMGSGYDCFDALSHTLHPETGELQLKNRLLLKQHLESHGFKNYKKEWWHYTYVEPYGSKQPYNFPVK